MSFEKQHLIYINLSLCTTIFISIDHFRSRVSGKLPLDYQSKKLFYICIHARVRASLIAVKNKYQNTQMTQIFRKLRTESDSARILRKPEYQSNQKTRLSDLRYSDPLAFRHSESPSSLSVLKPLATILLVLNLISITGFASPKLLAKAGFQLLPRTQVLGETTQQTTVTYNLLIGWNLVHFPLKPTEFTTAAGLVETVAKKGGYVTTIATWEDGIWTEYVQRGATAYSPDFPIQPGKAYFLRSHRELEWQVTGTPVAVTKLALKPGWNTIGLTPGENIHAGNILHALNNKNTQEKATELDRWLSGNWQVFVTRVYSTDNIQEYGDDFSLSDIEGYMIKSNDYLELQLEAN